MRLQVEVRREDEDPLRILAIRDHRSVREQCAEYIARGVREDLAKAKQDPELETVA
jgi:hypothetical protein